MRVAPLGAYFAHDLDILVRQAELSAVVTHSHPEGVAGAIAIAPGSRLGVAARDYSNFSAGFPAKGLRANAHE